MGYGRNQEKLNKKHRRGPGITKAELIARIATRSQLTKAERENILGALSNGITGILPTQGKLHLPGFSVLCVQERPARTERHPQDRRAHRHRRRQSREV